MVYETFLAPGAAFEGRLRPAPRLDVRPAGPDEGEFTLWILLQLVTVKIGDWFGKGSRRTGRMT